MGHMKALSLPGTEAHADFCRFLFLEAEEPCAEVCAAFAAACLFWPRPMLFASSERVLA
jgi:hypothetical protein